MPWDAPRDALRHTRLAKTPRLQKIWLGAANSALEQYGDEGRAIRIANAAVSQAANKKVLTRKQARFLTGK